LACIGDKRLAARWHFLASYRFFYGNCNVFCAKRERICRDTVQMSGIWWSAARTRRGAPEREKMSKKDMDSKLKVVILRILSESDAPIGSAAIARRLQEWSFDLSPRTVRLYLEDMENAGLVSGGRRGRGGGRAITPQGMREIEDALVTERVGMMLARLDSLASQMTFDPDNGRGNVVINITLIAASDLERALAAMAPVYDAGLALGNRIVVAREGERLGRVNVPAGKAAIGTVCSVTINGALLGVRVPTTTLFGGVLELVDRKPLRFTDAIYYSGSSLDPLEIFIKSGLTSVCKVAQTGNGRIGASFREVPSVALGAVERTFTRLRRCGLGGLVIIGRPNQPLLDIPVSEGKTGLVIAGGLNAAAALQESGIVADNTALSTTCGYARLAPCSEILERVRRASADAGTASGA